jgi:nucleotide-binding universal stress UspA family protein
LSRDEDESSQTRSIVEQVHQRGEQGDVDADIAFERGDVTQKILERAYWADLVIISLNFPPDARPITRLGSKLRLMIRRSSRPILAVPGEPSDFQRPLLAYDGSRTSDEALFIATSIASRWKTRLDVITVREAGIAPDAIENAKNYLNKHQVKAMMVDRERGPVGEQILEVASQRENDVILLGSYGHHPFLEAVLGSAIDPVLRGATSPILICK